MAPKKRTTKKTTAGEGAAKKATAKKTAAKKATAKKTAAKKTTAPAKNSGAPTPGSDTPKQPPRRRAPTLGNPGADPQRIHREYVEQHTGGGEEPTPEAYERGLEQWHRLPGAVNQPPAEVRVRDTGIGPDGRPPHPEESTIDDKEGDEEGSPS